MVRKLAIGCVIIAFLALMLVGVGVRQVYRFWLSQPSEDAQGVQIVVEEGDTLSSVIPKLGDAVSPFWFKVYAKFSGQESSIHPGTFTFHEGASYRAILQMLQVGSVNDVTLTIPEGFAITQMGERVVAAFPRITMEEWARVTGQFSPLEEHPFVIAAEKPDDVDLEGYLFPDTYSFFADATAEDIAKKMIDTMYERVATAGIHVAPDGEAHDAMSIHEMLTLASIVEKEVRQLATMKNVADIFLKRLEIGMALQSDATVNYITGGDDPSVSYADLEIDSLYNTYKYPGLPPGPISNPGLNALMAVAAPTANDYYYFLTTDEGDVYYAETHDEHVANKSRYLR